MRRKTKAPDPTIQAVTALYAVTSVHHLYGGLAFDSIERQILALVFTVLFGVTVWLCRAAAAKRWARRAYLGVVVGFWIVLLGLYEGGFNHTLYTVLRVAAVDEDTLRRLYPAGSDAVVSDDVFFQGTGVLTLVAAVVLAVVLVASRQRGRTQTRVPAGRFAGEGR